jgi:two-component system chemotaxis response regulator CheY
MPDMSGKETLTKLLENDPGVNVLLASGFSEEDQHNDLIKMGAKGFIGKPFFSDKILKKIRDVLD